MGFNRENYKRIKEEYEGKYLRAREAAEMRKEEVHAAVEEVGRIDAELSAVGLRIMECAMKNDLNMLESVKKRNRELLDIRKELLVRAGYPEDYTEVRYECPLCGDTGEVDNRMCVCMKKKLIEAGFETSGMSNLIEKQRFDNFSLEYYAKSPESFKRMTIIYKTLFKYANEFDPKTSKNIAMFGPTGLGKTHLSSAVARVVIENGYDVYYSGALDMLSDFEYSRFKSGAGAPGGGNTDRYYDCDLLIVDDLGTEVSNQFTTSCLYNIINTRLNKGRQTIISTNLTQEEFRKRYWDRITSRVLGEFMILPFIGQDIRSQKLMKNN